MEIAEEEEEEEEEASRIKGAGEGMELVGLKLLQSPESMASLRLLIILSIQLD